MAVRTIRCGRCRYEFIIGGVSETTCPQCGARNRIPVADATPPPGPAAATEADGSAPGAPTEADPAAPESAPANGPTWVVCPSCSYRFAVGDVERVKCPLCSTAIDL